MYTAKGWEKRSTHNASWLFNVVVDVAASFNCRSIPHIIHLSLCPNHDGNCHEELGIFLAKCDIYQSFFPIAMLGSWFLKYKHNKASRDLSKAIHQYAASIENSCPYLCHLMFVGEGLSLALDLVVDTTNGRQLVFFTCLQHLLFWRNTAMVKSRCNANYDF